MKTIYIKLTGYCNLKCNHCYAHKSLNTKIDIITASEWIYKFVSLLDEQEPVEIIFHGGEPLLCAKELCYAQNILKNISNPKRFCVTTNLMYSLDNEDVKTALKNLDQISISFDYGNIRFKSNDQLHFWENNIKKLQSLFPEKQLQINVVLTNETLKINPENFLLYVKSLNFHTIHLERMTLDTRIKIDAPKWEDIDNWLCKLYDLNKNYNIPVTMFNDLITAHKTGELKNCRARQCSKNVITIDNTGIIYGCPNTCGGEWIKGDMNEEPTDNLMKICPLEENKPDKCFICEFYNMCNGDCYQLQWQDNICPAPKNLMKKIKEDF